MALKKNKKGKEFLNKIKKLYYKYKDKFIEIYGDSFFYLMLPFVLMESFIFVFGSNINYSNFFIISPILFMFTWILLFIGLSISLKGIIGKIIYVFFNIIFFIMFLANNIYYSTMHTFFDFKLIESASEGSSYIVDAIVNCNKLVYVACVVVLITFIYAVIKFPKVEKNDYNKLKTVALIFLIMHIITPFTYGFANKDLTWSSWRNPRNVYNSFNDNNKSMRISGFYEYTFRNFYITFLKSNVSISEEEMEFLDSAYKEELNKKNKYTSKLKGKNLIFIQLEGTDRWLINKNDTPTIYKLMNEGINFNNHYSFYNGGGSTFNSEFAVNTGLVTPFSYNKNAYSFNKNSFPNSLAMIFKNEGYKVNAFHMNNGEFYSRRANYKNWGYDNYYGLVDVKRYDDQSYELDRELILNETFNELMFDTENLFVDYIITYSGHTPFTNTKGVCKLLYDIDNEGIADNEFVQMSEEECVRRQAKETDYMLELLIKNLKEKGLYDNTVLVVFTDHYLYTLTDQTILSRYKNTMGNLINNTTWFIWSKNIKSTKVDKVTSQLNILPTILNLYGIKYNVNNYLCKDALDSKYEGLVFFNDYSWYDGNVYVENGEVINKKKISSNNLEKKNQYVVYLSKKNDLTLKYDYFKK